MVGKKPYRPYVIHSGNSGRDKGLERKVQRQINDDKKRVGEEEYYKGLNGRLQAEQERVAKVNAVDAATLQKDAETAAENLERMEVEVNEDEEENDVVMDDVLAVHPSPNDRIEGLDARDKSAASAADQVQCDDAIKANQNVQMPSTSQGITREVHPTPTRPELVQALSPSHNEGDREEAESYEEYDEEFEGELLGMSGLVEEGEEERVDREDRQDA